MAADADKPITSLIRELGITHGSSVDLAQGDV